MTFNIRPPPPRLKIPSADKNVELTELTYAAGGTAKMDKHFEKLVDTFLQINLCFLYNPVFPLLDIYTIFMMVYDDICPHGTLCINTY